MVGKGTSFLFYEEESLTDPNGTIFEFKSSENFPIGISDNDLELFVTDDTLEGVLLGLKLAGILSLNAGVELEYLVEELQGKRIFFNQTLEQYCELDLIALTNLSTHCNVINFSDFELFNKGSNLNIFTGFLPEFILDFGEDLEEKATLCWVGGVGILGEPHSGNIDPKGALASLCSSYLVLENMHYVLEHFDPDRIEQMLEEHIRDKVLNAANCEQLGVVSHKLISGPLEGVSKFVAKLEAYRNSLPNSLSHVSIHDLYSRKTFSQNGIKIEFELEISTTKSFNRDDHELFERNFKFVNRKTCQLKGNSAWGHENVWWLLEDVMLKEKSPTSLVWTFITSPRFGPI